MSRLTTTFFCTFALTFSCIANAQESAKLAEVNGLPISSAVVHHVLDRTFSVASSPITRQGRSDAVTRAGLEHCINREVILQHLQSKKSAITDAEADRLVGDVKSAVELSHPTFEAFLESISLSAEEHRRELIWNRAWRKYARTHVTEEHLRKQFEQRKKTLDGTKVHIAQILWKNTDDETLEKAKQIREQLVTQQLTWKDAVIENSQSASASNGGDLGWLKFSGPMPRNFTNVAYELNEGDFSQPFTSSFGTHLIHCIAIETGTKTFGDVAIERRESETKRLFGLVAKRHRANATIEIFLKESPALKSDSTKTP